MLNKSIAYRLSIYISLAVIGVFLAFIAIFLLFNLRLIKENVQHKAISASTIAISDVRKHVITTREVAQNITGQIAFYEKVNASESFLTSLMRRYPFINAIHVNFDSTLVQQDFTNYYCYRSGDSIKVYSSRKPVKNCVTKAAVGSDKGIAHTAHWSEPLMCKRNEIVVVTYYAPIHDVLGGQGETLGYVVCELSLNELSKAVNELNIGNNGFAFLISREGTFITHPIKNWILTHNIKDVSPEVFPSDRSAISEMLKRGGSGSAIAYPQILNHRKSWVYYTTIEETGWIMLFVVPYSELYAPVYLPLLKMLFFSVLGILVVYLLITYITNREIEPLSDVAASLRHFSRLSGEQQSEEETMNEIKQVSESLREMQLWYERSRLKEDAEAQKKRMQRQDLNQAAEIQKSLIKVDFPAFPNRTDVDLFAIYKPVRIISGDLFDYFFRDEDNLVLTMGDVSGKGVPAAFFMSVAQTLIKTIAIRKNMDPASIVVEVNNELYTNNLHQFFLTLFLGILDVRTGILEYCNAAHNNAYILKANGEVIRLGESHGLPLGLYPNRQYAHSRAQLAKGDTLILYTDGVTELRDKNELQFGSARLIENIKILAGSEPQELIERLQQSLNLFKGEADQVDDITIMAVKYYG